MRGFAADYTVKGYLVNGVILAFMAVWMFSAQVLGGQPWLALQTAAAVFAYLSCREFWSANRLRRHEQVSRR
jgi:hypothetical protein